MAVKNFVFVNENAFTWRCGQNYTLSYYQLTFSESNRLIVSVICAWLSDRSNFSNYKIVKNPSSMKQNNWTTSCTQNEAKRAQDTLIWLESVTEKVTGNAQTGACVDVLPRCSKEDKCCSWLRSHSPSHSPIDNCSLFIRHEEYKSQATSYKYRLCSHSLEQSRRQYSFFSRSAKPAGGFKQLHNKRPR